MKPMVILCECGGYHAKADCPKRWEEFNAWFYASGQPSARSTSRSEPNYSARAEWRRLPSSTGPQSNERNNSK